MARLSALSPATAVFLLSFLTSTIAQPRPGGQTWQPNQAAQQQQPIGGAATWQPGQQQQQPPSGGTWQPGGQQQQQGGGTWQPGQQQQQQQQPASGGAWQPGQQQQQQQQPPSGGAWQPGQQQQPVNPGNWQPGQQQGGQQPPTGGTVPQQPPTGGTQQPPTGGTQQPPTGGTQQPPTGGTQPGNTGQQPQTLPGIYNPNANVGNTAICPQNELQHYSAQDGSFFMVRCNFHHWVGTTLENTKTNTYQECIDKCAAKDGCKAVNWDNTGPGQCYLMAEGGVTDKAVNCGVHHYAFMVDPPTKPAADDMTVMCSTECPYANHNTYNSIFGSAWRITCGRRHGTPTILSDGRGSLKDCIDACAGTNGCDSVDYHERSKTCYYSTHKGYPPMEAAGYASAWNVGCAGACGGGCGGCGSQFAPGTYPQLPKVFGPPKPDMSCGNQGMQHYASPNTDTNGNKVTNIDLFDPTILKRRNPNSAGQSSDNPPQYRFSTNTKVGFDSASTNPVDIYGYKQDFGTFADNLAINHRAYLFAPKTGTYTFTLPSSDDITLLWIGQKAYSGYTRQNADIIQQYVASGGKSVEFRTDLTQGTYYPLRIVWANRGGAGNFKLRIKAPDGSILLDQESDSNDYIVQYSCDGSSAPKFPDWGFEN